MNKTDKFKNLIKQLKDDEGLSGYGVVLLETCFKEEMQEAIKESLQSIKTVGEVTDKEVDEAAYKYLDSEQTEGDTTNGEKMFFFQGFKSCFKWMQSKGEGETWINYTKNKPELGIEVLAQNDNWINEDYNPKGIRIGFQNVSKCDKLGEFVSAKYNNTHDCYDTIERDKPTKWCLIKIT